MADERDDEPKIRVVDRRMLSDDERAGKGTASGDTTASEAPAPPKLEIIGGGTPSAEQPAEQPLAASYAEPEQVHDLDEADEMTEEEADKLRGEIEHEQFAAIEAEMGRPLTDQEKQSVRAEMDRRAQAMTSLEVAPVLQQVMVQLSQFAAVHLGLMPNPYTRLIARNDSQARMAIDAFGALLDVLKPTLEPVAHRELTRVLNDLRVNFVSVTGAQPASKGLIIH